MKPKFLLPLLVLTLSTAAHASTLVLPDSCGKDDVKFDVKTRKNQPPPVPPDEGKAQIVFINTVHRPGFAAGAPDLTTRFGMDGSWVGAATGESYFTIEVPAGEHHVCASVQQHLGISGQDLKSMIAMDTFTAVAGKVYYYEYGFSRVGVVGRSYSLAQTNEEEGKFKVKSSEVSTSTPNK